MIDWPEYESHKVVRAARIAELIYDRPDGDVVSVVVVPEGGEPEEFTPTEQSMLKHAKVGGWAMLYPDGFRSVSPAKAFEDGYRLKPT